jgi:hypothetical protein
MTMTEQESKVSSEMTKLMVTLHNGDGLTEERNTSCMKVISLMVYTMVKVHHTRVTERLISKVNSQTVNQTNELIQAPKQMPIITYEFLHL